MGRSCSTKGWRKWKACRLLLGKPKRKKPYFQKKIRNISCECSSEVLCASVLVKYFVCVF
jgi:hypothetical protein